jgi:hypothetical protein
VHSNEELTRSVEQAEMDGLRKGSIIIDWLGWENGLVKQDVVRLRGRTPDQAVLDFTADRNPAKVIGWRYW